jgi:hypothetical protein
MASVESAIATFERNIAEQTGRPVGEWAAMALAQDLAKHGQIVAWLKAEHGLSHSHANHVAKAALKAPDPGPEGDAAAGLFDGGKSGLRPLYDRLAAEAAALGPDVEIAPKKANVSLRRRKQFALLQPSTRTRLDLGLILPGEPPSGRLEASGSFNAMFTHRVKVTSDGDIDAELLGWLRQAYDAAG